MKKDHTATAVRRTLHSVKSCDVFDCCSLRTIATGAFLMFTRDVNDVHKRVEVNEAVGGSSERRYSVSLRAGARDAFWKDKAGE